MNHASSSPQVTGLSHFLTSWLYWWPYFLKQESRSMFCLWLVNKRHDLKTKIVPESPRYTLSCSHDLSTTSPNPLHSLTQSLHLSFLSHEWEHKSSRGVVGSTGFLIPIAHQFCAPVLPSMPFWGNNHSYYHFCFGIFIFPFQLCEGQLLFYYSTRSYASEGGNWRHYNQLDKGFTSGSMTSQMGDIKYGT